MTGCLHGSAVRVMDGGSLRLRCCSITAGRCGVRAEGPGTHVELSECRISDCGEWGAVVSSNGDLRAVSTTMDGNYGGGLCVDRGSHASLSFCSTRQDACDTLVHAFSDGV